MQCIRPPCPNKRCAVELEKSHKREESKGRTGDNLDGIYREWIGVDLPYSVHLMSWGIEALQPISDMLARVSRTDHWL